MVQKSKLTDKPFRKTFKMALRQLGEMMNTEGISSMQKLLLYENLNGYRSMMGDNEVANSSSIELKSINRENDTIKDAKGFSFQKEETCENTTNIEKDIERTARSRKKGKNPVAKSRDDVSPKEESSSISKNMWGQKDMSTVLKERNAKIKQLDDEIEEYKKSLLEDRKRIKRDIDTVGMIEKAIDEKNIEIFGLKSEIGQLMSKIRDFELQLSISKDTIDIIKDNNKKVADLFNQRKQSPVAVNITEESTPSFKEDVYILKKKNTEMSTKISLLENERDVCKQKIANLESMLQDCGKRTEIFDSLKLLGKDSGDLEMSLIDELTSITKAYDDILRTNKSLEEQVASANNQSFSITTENMSLKNKLRTLEE